MRKKKLYHYLKKGISLMKTKIYVTYAKKIYLDQNEDDGNENDENKNNENVNNENKNNKKDEKFKKYLKFKDHCP